MDKRLTRDEGRSNIRDRFVVTKHSYELLNKNNFKRRGCNQRQNQADTMILINDLLIDYGIARGFVGGRFQSHLADLYDELFPMSWK